MRRIPAIGLLLAATGSLFAGGAAAEDTIDTWNLTYWRTVSTEHRLVAGADANVYFASAPGSPLQIGLQGGRQWEFASPSALEVEKVWADRVAANVLFAQAAEPGLFRSDDRGATWRKLLAATPDVLVQGNDPNFFLVASQGQIWVSTDAGESFSSRSHPEPAAAWSNAAAVQTSNGRLYLAIFRDCGIACGEGKLLRSTDHGLSWQQIATPPMVSDQATLLGHPSNTSLLYLVNQGDDSTVVLRSEDSGATWVQTTSKGFDKGEYSAFVASSNPDYLYVDDGDTFWVSYDTGLTFRDATPAGREARSWVVRSSGHVLATFFDEGVNPWVQNFSESSGALAAFTDFGGTGFAGGATNSIASTPSQGVFFVTSSDTHNYLWRTTDRGRSWQRRAEINDSTAIAVDPTNADVLMVSSFGRSDTPEREVLHRSVDGGINFVPVYSSTNPSSYVLRVRALRYQGQTVWVALYFEGGSRFFLRSTNEGATWTKTALPETPRDLLVDGTAIYITGQNDGFYRSFDGGQTLNKMPTPVERPVAAGGGVVAALDYQNAVLRVSVDNGANWAIRPLPRGVQEVDSFQADHLGRLFLAFNGNTLLRSDDQGRSFTALTKGLYNARIAQLAIDPFDAHHLLARTYEHGVLTATFGESPTLLLGEGRFEITLNWRTASGQTGVGVPTWLTGDTGLFWLFSRERSEVAVKVLDGRAINGRYWLFVASLSDVEYEIVLKDLYTGDERSHHKAQGAMESFADTEILPIGPAEESLPFAPGPVLLPRPDTTTVELRNRFEVSIHWKDPLGQEGEAIGFVLSEETAAFYFFEQKNIEVFVNLIDGRPLNGHWWVFFGGLSNVEYTVTVKDTDTQAVRTYHNAQGSFGSVADTGAF